ncbi:hypothetical protein HA402_011213 [Bradysia odoriphaga]|nr:hypothetical protein HA402_011213 [Bradysia odoriphaga]
MESESSVDIGSSATQNDSGVQGNPVTPKRPRLVQKSTKDGIVDNLFDEIGKFSATAAKMKIKEMEEELLPLPSHAEHVLRSNNDNVKLWSEYFYKKSTPTKRKRLNTIPSPPTARIGALTHAVGSFYGITA